MADEKRYNGWTNYETWNVALWMGNEQGSHRAAEEMAQESWDATGEDGTRDERMNEAKNAIADRLKDEYEEAMVNLLDRAGVTSSVWADLLAALSEVNWHEIAGNLLDDIDENAEPKDDGSEED